MTFGAADNPASRSLLGVQSGHDHLLMSAFAVAIGGKADMGLCVAHVCF